MLSILPNTLASAFVPISIGIVCGLVDTCFSTTVQKTCMIAGMKFEEIEDKDDVPSSERLDKYFFDCVVKYPILEELFFRSILQPTLSTHLTSSFPRLLAISYMGIPMSNLVSSIAIGTIFGACHYFAFEKGGGVVAMLSSISGSSYGIIKERFGIISSIAAHMTHNYTVGLIDKRFPSFLESDRDRILKQNN